MVACNLGHVFVINTVLTKPPKEKFALCVDEAASLFVWINSEPRQHGKDQMSIAVGRHSLIVHDSHLDLSRVVFHGPNEMDGAQQFECITRGLRDDIIQFIGAGLFIMPPRAAQTIMSNLSGLYK